MKLLIINNGSGVNHVHDQVQIEFEKFSKQSKKLSYFKKLYSTYCLILSNL